MDNAEILIEARSLTRQYGLRAAVSDLNLTLRKGEILGLLGPNGAGKSTTMKMLSGCLAPSSGTIKIKGIDLIENPTAAKTHLGYLPEIPPVYPELTVLEYVQYTAALHGLPSAQRASAVQRALASCGLSDVQHRLIGNLSKGYQQRVGLAQSIVHQPPVIILDEPTVGLDPIQIREIRALIKQLAEHHSVILSSHILPEIQAVCSRVMIINKGRVVYANPMSAFESNQRFAAVTVGLRHPPQASALASLPGVEHATALSQPGYFRLSVSGNADPREALAAAAVAQGWGLLELHAETKTLEEVFVELTSGDVQLHEAQAA